MKNTLSKILIIISFFFIGYIIFNKILPQLVNTKEGLENNSIDPSISSTTFNDGVAANSAKFSADLKSNILKQQDTLLIGKYKTDYENIILNTDDAINLRMLNTLLKMDPENPDETYKKIVLLKETKVALNDIMKFVDSKNSSFF